MSTGAEPVALRLESVADMAGATSRRALVGSEDAFALTFSGPLAEPLDSGIHMLRHPSLGSAELFSSPVDTPAGNRLYEVVVDRSVGAATQSDAPKAPDRPQPEPREPDPEPQPKPMAKPQAALVRRVSLRRAGRWARCEVVLARNVPAERVRAALARKGKVVATASRAVSDQRAVLRFESEHKLAAGTYTLIVTAFDAAGTATSQRKRVTLR